MVLECPGAIYWVKNTNVMKMGEIYLIIRGLLWTEIYGSDV